MEYKNDMKLFKGFQYYMSVELDSASKNIDITIVDYMHRLKIAEESFLFQEGASFTVHEMLSKVGKTKLDDNIFNNPIYDVSNEREELKNFKDVMNGKHKPYEIAAIYNQDGQFDAQVNDVLYVEYKIYKEKEGEMLLAHTGTLCFDHLNSEKELFQSEFDDVMKVALNYIQSNENEIGTKRDVQEAGTILQESVKQFSSMDQNEIELISKDKMNQSDLDQLWKDINEYQFETLVTAPKSINEVSKDNPIIINRKCCTVFDDKKMFFPDEKMYEPVTKQYGLNQISKNQEKVKANEPIKDHDEKVK